MNTLPKWVLSAATFLLRRQWGRKIVVGATEYVLRRKLEQWWRATREWLEVAGYYLIGRVDAWLHPRSSGTRESVANA